MLERFASAFVVDEGRVGNPWTEPALAGTSGYVEIAQRLAGLSVGHGILRFVDDVSGPVALGAIRTAFPSFASRAVPVARDWLGRHFAIDKGRTSGTGSQMLLLEPGSGEVYEIDADLQNFLAFGVVADPETYLEAELFGLWARSGGGAPGPNECVGFRVPLFLGGSGSVDNLEIVDVEVYWELCAQMFAATRRLPPGAAVNGLEIR